MGKIQTTTIFLSSAVESGYSLPATHPAPTPLLTHCRCWAPLLTQQEAPFRDCREAAKRGQAEQWKPYIMEAELSSSAIYKRWEKAQEGVSPASKGVRQTDSQADGIQLSSTVPQLHLKEHTTRAMTSLDR